MATQNGVIEMLGIDNTSKLIVYRAPAPEDAGEDTFIISITSDFGQAQGARAMVLSNDSINELVCQLTGLICAGEQDRLRVLNDGIEPEPLSKPLQNLLLHIRRAAGDRLKINDNEA